MHAGDGWAPAQTHNLTSSLASMSPDAKGMLNDKHRLALNAAAVCKMLAVPGEECPRTGLWACAAQILEQLTHTLQGCSAVVLTACWPMMYASNGKASYAVAISAASNATCKTANVKSHIDGHQIHDNRGRIPTSGVINVSMMLKSGSMATITSGMASKRAATRSEAILRTKWRGKATSQSPAPVPMEIIE